MTASVEQRLSTETQPCGVCAQPAGRSHELLVLGKYPVGYYACGHCGLMQTQRPYWLDEAYSRAIASSDTGLVSRNVAVSVRLAAVLGAMFDRGAAFVDVGAGYGMLTRLMRDFGFDFYWDDPFCDNLFAGGFVAADRPGPYAAVTAFEVMEHVHDPGAFVRDALDRWGARTFVFSTQLFAGPPPDPATWAYYSPETGQHVSFYQRETLDYLATHLGLRCHSAGYFHMFTDRPVAAWRFRAAASWLSAAALPFIRRSRGPRTVADRDRALARLRATGRNVVSRAGDSTGGAR